MYIIVEGLPELGVLDPCCSGSELGCLIEVFLAVQILNSAATDRLAPPNKWRSDRWKLSSCLLCGCRSACRSTPVLRVAAVRRCALPAATSVTRESTVNTDCRHSGSELAKRYLSGKVRKRVASLLLSSEFETVAVSCLFVHVYLDF